MVFFLSLAIVVLFVIWGVVAPESLTTTTADLLSYATHTFGWFFLLATFGFLLFSLFLAFGRFGDIRLGSDDDEPEYTTTSWFAMLFSAGMGIGLVFWGVAEPLSHYLSPPLDLQGGSVEAARAAMQYSFFHWGLHPWGIYCVIGLSLAYFNFRRGAKSLISSTFQPLLGERINGPIGKGIDTLAIIATAFGVATSLGFGTLQINGGISHLFGTPNSAYVQIAIIAVLTILYLLSSTTGLEKGIKTLSNTNLLIAFLLLMLTLFLGPTLFIFDTFTTTIGTYLQNLISMSTRLTPFTQGTWVGAWTLFYWAWWIAWAPFVGMFIARVSKGRTVRQFIVGVLLVPSLLSFIWFSVFGGTGLYYEMFEHAGLAQAAQKDVTAVLFQTLDQLPLGTILSVVATLLIITFFITSADSATFVLGMLSSKGNMNPTNRVKMTWGILQSLIAVVLLLSGGLQGLQTASILAALPFALIMVLMCVSLYKALDEEVRSHRKKERERKKKLEKLLRDIQ